jgi:cytidylate kinase
VIIAIDGPAAAGKGTLGRRLAETLNLAYLDTGSIYRALAAKLLEAGHEASEEAAAVAAARSLRAEDLLRPDLRSEPVGRAASQVAANPAVRRELLAFQRRFAAHPPDGKAGAVLDGRDIGTVVCPDADAKLYVTASLEERARRRHQELRERGEASIYARVLADMRERDTRDSARSVAPLKPSDDAFRLDTDHLDIDAAFAAALAFVRSRTGSRET